ncbi:hypothetical protein BJ166DRAFT_355170 [Pestalotiopsis sp. NC0098]|nr:hypothetical protein BJ166DRAFT_355170 [Pestalotiopsis sp. NC0098]
MPGRIVSQWPAWPEYGHERSKDKDKDFVASKQAVIAQYGRENLIKSWVSVCSQLEAVTDEIATKGSDMIPVLLMEDVLKNGGLTEDQKSKLKRTGCFMVKGVIPHEEATEMYASLQRYVSDNRDDVKGWPEESPSILRIYDSPAQNDVRAHKNQLRLQLLLNELWHDKTGETSPEPLVYLDGVRDRPPHQPFLGLGPHIDTGGLCRWADPAHRRVYSQIFGGNPDAHDPYDLALRKDADQAFFPGDAHATPLRAFQGWTALTRAAPREGTLMVVPNLKTTLAYLLLRPFFSPPRDPADIMDASKWTFDESGSFPGTTKPDSQQLSRSSHPHLRLEETLVHVPAMEAGDTIWWHADVCHAVDPEHQGTENAAVVYVPSCPTTALNKKYVKGQLEAILNGRIAPDHDIGAGINEKLFTGYKGHEGFSDEARRAFGYHL